MHQTFQEQQVFAELFSVPDTIYNSISLRDSSDLNAFGSLRAQKLGNELGDFLRSIKYDLANQTVFAYYNRLPLPKSLDRELIEEDLSLDIASQYLTREQILAVRLFLLGESLTSNDLINLFGDSADFLIQAGLEHELFTVKEGLIRTNDLLIGSYKISQESEVYFIADLPENCRVHTGYDTYYLLNDLLALSAINGSIIEFGPGSGIHLSALLKLHDSIPLAVGIEIDQRASNCTRFTGALNGVQDRLVVEKNIADVLLHTDKFPPSLAFTNPSFIPLPNRLYVQQEEIGVLTAAGIYDPTRRRPDCSVLFPVSDYGGVDGLETTRLFLDYYERVKNEHSSLKVFSQFLGNETEPTAIESLLNGRNIGNLRKFHHFQTPWFEISVDDHLRFIEDRLAKEHPELLGSAFIRHMQSELSLAFSQRGYTKLYTGILTIEEGQGESSNLSIEKFPMRDHLNPSRFEPSPLRETAEEGSSE